MNKTQQTLQIINETVDELSNIAEYFNTYKDEGKIRLHKIINSHFDLIKYINEPLADSTISNS